MYMTLYTGGRSPDGGGEGEGVAGEDSSGVREAAGQGGQSAGGGSEKRRPAHTAQGPVLVNT